MRLLIQRVKHAKVVIREEEFCKIDKGVVVFVGIGKDDTPKVVDYLARRLSTLRIFEDMEGKTNLSILESDAELIVISQFTLYGDTKKGRRPDFGKAAQRDMADGIYHDFLKALTSFGLRVKSGVFGERMEVIIHNDGPFTLIMDSRG